MPSSNDRKAYEPQITSRKMLIHVRYKQYKKLKEMSQYMAAYPQSQRRNWGWGVLGYPAKGIRRFLLARYDCHTKNICRNRVSDFCVTFV